MDPIWLRTAGRLEFKDPRKFLIELPRLEELVALSDLPTEVKSLRTNDLKKAREHRQAALFCCGMSERIGCPVLFADQESQDYDFVAAWFVGDTQHLTPVQLKELPPDSNKRTTVLDDVVEGLSRYPVSRETLTVGIHLNQALRFEPSNLVVPALNIAALWIFGSTAQDQSQWAMWGDFMQPPVNDIRFFYPTEA